MEQQRLRCKTKIRARKHYVHGVCLPRHNQIKQASLLLNTHSSHPFIFTHRAFVAFLLLSLVRFSWKMDQLATDVNGFTFDFESFIIEKLDICLDASTRQSKCCFYPLHPLFIEKGKDGPLFLPLSLSPSLFYSIC